MKKCIGCDESDPAKFYNKYESRCKTCKCAWQAAYRAQNIESVKEYDRNRPNHKDRIMQNRERLKTENGRRQHKEALAKYKAKFPERKKAADVVSSALRGGKLLRQPCVKCGAVAEAHHEDYSKPLEVIWYCDTHHKQRHREIRATQRRVRKTAGV